MHIVESHGLAQPTHEELRFSLGQVMSEPEVEATLSGAQRELRLSAMSFGELSDQQLLALTELLTRQRGLASIIARSFAIRLSSYEALNDSRRAHA